MVFYDEKGELDDCIAFCCYLRWICMLLTEHLQSENVVFEC